MVFFSKIVDFRELSLSSKIVRNGILNNFCNNKFLPEVNSFEANRQFLIQGRPAAISDVDSHFGKTDRVEIM
jgi:hypothetical protein